MRLFVAGYPPAQACDDLERHLPALRLAQAAAAGVNVRLAPRANWHITLAFLGEVAEERLPDVCGALTDAIGHWRSGLTGPPRLRLAGGGRFGRGRFTILWVGLDGAVPALVSLNTAIRRQLRPARLPFDPRPFRAHLTLARPGDRLDATAVAADREALRGYAGPDWPLEQIRLVQSRLGPKPTYETLADWPTT